MASTISTPDINDLRPGARARIKSNGHPCIIASNPIQNKNGISYIIREETRGTGRGRSLGEWMSYLLEINTEKEHQKHGKK